ncbi:MAG TPA: type II secretion system major pseudopilin GspG [Rhizomicrobium sp.]|nr:type II secretion system major pseudopilin GspG [Rhizomicrobium sp.]
MKYWKTAARTPAISAAMRGRFSRVCKPQSRRSGEAGYTLMELLVVLAILGLLAAVATPMVLHYLDSAKVSTAKTEVSNLSAGLDLFKYDVGRYPTTEEGLEALISAPEGVENWNGPYIKKTTKLNDPWGHPYNYRYPGTHGGEFDLYSYGAHPDEAKADEKPPIANW